MVKKLFKKLKALERNKSKISKGEKRFTFDESKLRFSSITQIISTI